MGWRVSWRFKVDYSSVGQTVARSSTGQNPKLGCYRHYEEAVEDVSLHTFADASRLGYAAVSYAKYGNVSGQISCSLVTAKARIIPIKFVSIPRLGLIGSSTRSAVSWNGLWEARNSAKSTHPVDEQYGCNLLNPGSLKTTEIVCCYSKSRHSTEIGPTSMPTYTRKTEPRWRRNKRSGPEKPIRWKSLVPGTCLSTWGETSWSLESRLRLSDCSEEGKQELAKINLVSMQAVPALVWHREVFFLPPIVRSYSLDQEIHFQKYRSKSSEKPRDRKQAKRLTGKSPRSEGNQ